MAVKVRHGAAHLNAAPKIYLRSDMSQVPLPEHDSSLEQANQLFWEALLGHIRRELAGNVVDEVLDVGCHNGGLLSQLASTFHPNRMTGIEPASHCRERALFRLRTLAPRVAILPPKAWPEVPSSSIDIVTCHEVLHLVEDLHHLFGNIARVLRPQGIAFVVVGCHSENPVWRTWSAELRDSGQTVFDRTAFDILHCGIAAGMQGALRPLRRDGWIIYNPKSTVFSYPSIGHLLDHQYRNKLLFRFIRRS